VLESRNKSMDGLEKLLEDITRWLDKKLFLLKYRNQVILFIFDVWNSMKLFISFCYFVFVWVN